MNVLKAVEAKYQKRAVVDVRSGDTVKVHQKIREGNKERVQIFEGLVIRVGRKASLTNTITVRKIASGVGVEKTYLLHSPNVLKVEVTKRSKVRRNYLTYMRALTGKNARLSGVAFDASKVNDIHDAAAEAEEEKLKEETEKAAQADADAKAKEAAELEAKAAAALAARESSEEE
jgi:large subunit ribosomal protein L19